MSSRPGAGGRVQASNLQAAATGQIQRSSSSSGAPTSAVGQLPDGELTARRDAPLGGQAVLEGVMMRGVRHWAVAVRKPLRPGADAQEDGDSQEGSKSSREGSESRAGIDESHDERPGSQDNHTANARDVSHSLEVAFAREGELSREEEQGQLEELGEIEVVTFPLTSALVRHRWLRLPILRGIVALGGSLAIGFRALGISANAQLPEGEADEDAQEIGTGVWVGTVVVAMVFAIGLFFLLPLGLTSLIKGQLGSSALFWIVEGIVRTLIFLGYMVLLSRIKDLRRVFEYHGAEHKTISCFEAGLPLTPANAQRFSRLHPRCGTSFLLIVMVVSIFVFGAVGLPAWYLLVASRILGVPIIAGISFEIIKFAGRNRNRRWVKAVMWPGLKLQLLTTQEPSLDQLAVAIAALEAVLELETPGSMDAADLVGVEVVA
ncbi:MAG TPA: DUF1385 domain-containing protein [Solirubrobacteraceae bacterium]|nr:DUF1385 domain-containing protein [Solirubrobacteraceae bacterium]